MARRVLVNGLVVGLCILPFVGTIGQTKSSFSRQLFDMLGPGDGTSIKLKAEIRRRLAKARGREAALYRRLGAYIARMEKPDSVKIRWAFQEYHAILMEASRVWKHDVDAQAKIGSLLMALAHTAQGALKPPESSKLTISATGFADAFYRRHKNRADAAGLRGDSCSLQRPRDIACMRYYLECMRMKPTVPSCRFLYERFIEFHRRPHCKTNDVAALRFVALRATGDRDQKPYYSDDKGAWYRVPGLDDIVGGEIAEIVRGKSPHGPRSLVILKPGGARKLAKTSKKLVGIRGRMAIVRGKKILAAPRVAGELNTPRIELGLPIDQLCVKTLRGVVPAKYRLPGKE